MKSPYLIFLFFSQVTYLIAQPTLVKDINTIPESTSIIAYAQLNDELYFMTNSFSGPDNFWKTDGTSEGTTLVAGLDGLSNFGSALVSFGDKLFFIATSSSFGTELMMADGSGSVSLLKDITVGTASTSFFPQFAVCSGKLYFVVRLVGQNQLWISDGTEAGTKLVKSFQNVSVGSFGCQNGKIIFAGNSGTGSKVWASDGTEIGTTVILNQCCVGEFIEFNGLTYFTNSSQLWNTNGTAIGTNQVSFPGVNNFMISNNGLATYCNKLYFPAGDNNTGIELWSYDGIQVSLVSEIAAGVTSGTPRALKVSGPKLYFLGDDPVAGTELFSFDCIGSGINLVKDINPGLDGSTPLIGPGSMMEVIEPFDGKVLYAATDGNTGAEWWLSDGTAVGTELLKDLNPGPAPSLNSSIFKTGFNGAFYFLGDDGQSGFEIYKTNGSDAGTTLLSDLSPSSKTSNILNLFKPHNQLTFVATDGGGFDLWTSDGTSDGTKLVKEIGGPQTFNSTRIFEFGSKFVFAIQSDDGFELWISDGTTFGTNQVTDLNPGSGNGVNTVSFGINDQLLVFAGTGANGLGSELWRSDGTEAGTTFVKDIYTGNSSSAPHDFVLINNVLYFFALDAAGVGLWSTDGTAMNTMKIRAFASGSFIFGGQTQARTFFGFNHSGSFDLWKTDGTTGGTELVKTILGAGSPTNFTATNNKLFFAYDDGSLGKEMWVTDGTSLGTLMIKDINVGQPSSILSDNASQAIGDKVYFAADNGIDGNELWETDGTQLGTKLIFDLQSGVSSSNPYFLRAAGVNLFFSALHDGTTKLWHWNTSKEMPVVIDASNPSNFTLIERTLYFLADDELTDRELWKYEFSEADLAAKPPVDVPEPTPQPEPEPVPEPITSIDGNNANSVIVYPNPTDGQLNILNGLPNQSFYIKDVMGRKVDFKAVKSAGLTQIDLTSVQPGIYILELSVRNGFGKKIKIIKR